MPSPVQPTWISAVQHHLWCAVLSALRASCWETACLGTARPQQPYVFQHLVCWSTAQLLCLSQLLLQLQLSYDPLLLPLLWVQVLVVMLRIDLALLYSLAVLVLLCLLAVLVLLCLLAVLPGLVAFP